jgi:hypothetical protein
MHKDIHNENIIDENINNFEMNEDDSFDTGIEPIKIE